MKPQTYFAQIPREDKEILRQRRLDILDMIRAKIEAGEVDSLAILFVGPDPEVSGGIAPNGSRFLVHVTHMDLVDDLYQDMMKRLASMYGYTAEQIRDMRRKS